MTTFDIAEKRRPWNERMDHELEGARGRLRDSHHRWIAERALWLYQSMHDQWPLPTRGARLRCHDMLQEILEDYHDREAREYDFDPATYRLGQHWHARLHDIAHAVAEQKPWRKRVRDDAAELKRVLSALWNFEEKEREYDIKRAQRRAAHQPARS